MMFWRKRCPFCQHRPVLAPTNGTTSTTPLYKCSSCTSTFTVLPSGDYDVVPTPAMYATASATPTCINTPSTGTWAPLLCAQCNANQSVLLHLINNPPEELFAGDGGDDMDSQGVVRWRRGVEGRYPLCGACQFAVAERLKQVAFRVRCARISGRTVGRERAFGVKARAFSVPFVAALEAIACTLIWYWMDSVGYRRDYTCAILVVLAGVMCMVSQNVFLTVLVNAVKGYTVCVRDDVALLPFVSAFYILCLFAVKFVSKPRSAKMDANITIPETTGREKENQRPTTSFASLSLSNNPPNRSAPTNNPFQLKAKQSAVTSVKLRPTKLDYAAQSSGLEDLFTSTIRLNDPHITAPPSSKTTNIDSIQQSLLSVALLALRLAIQTVDRQQQVPMVLLLFCAAFYWRPFWQDRLGWMVKAVYVVLLVVRLAWLALSVTAVREFDVREFDVREFDVLGAACDCCLLLLR